MQIGHCGTDGYEDAEEGDGVEGSGVGEVGLVGAGRFRRNRCTSTTLLKRAPDWVTKIRLRDEFFHLEEAKSPSTITKPAEVAESRVAEVMVGVGAWVQNRMGRKSYLGERLVFRASFRNELMKT